MQSLNGNYQFLIILFSENGKNALCTLTVLPFKLLCWKLIAHICTIRGTRPIADFITKNKKNEILISDCKNHSH